MHLRIPHLASRISIMALLCVSCATLGRLAFTEPDVELQEIAVTGIGLTGGTFELAFDVYNPNDYRIRSTRLEVGIDLEGTHFGDAMLDRPLDLSPTNHSRIVVPVRFEWAGLGAGAKEIGRASCRERGEISGGAVSLKKKSATHHWLRVLGMTYARTLLSNQTKRMTL